MIDQVQKGRPEGVAVATPVVSCTFCGRPNGRPIYGLSEVSVCDGCLRTACAEMLKELDALHRL